MRASKLAGGRHPRASRGLVLIALGASGCGDLFHTTSWSTACESDPAGTPRTPGSCVRTTEEEGGATAGPGGATDEHGGDSGSGGGSPYDATGGAAPAMCSASEDCATPEDDDCNGSINDGCLPSGYSLGQEPDTGSLTYFDEPHNMATTGAATDGSKHAKLAKGQLVDGAVGVADYHVDLGSGAGYEWVGWSLEEVELVFEFDQPRDIEKVVLGTMSRTAGHVYEPIEVRVSFSDDGKIFSPVTLFSLDDGTLPEIPDATRADVPLAVPKTTARYVRIRLVPGGKWVFLDEVAFD